MFWKRRFIGVAGLAAAAWLTVASFAPLQPTRAGAGTGETSISRQQYSSAPIESGTRYGGASGSMPGTVEQVNCEAQVESCQILYR